MPHHFVYITASKRNGTLYIGKSSDVLRRIEQHRSHLVKGARKADEGVAAEVEAGAD